MTSTPVIHKTNGIRIFFTGYGDDGVPSGRVVDESGKQITIRGFNDTEAAVFEKAKREGRPEVTMHAPPRLC